MSVSQVIAAPSAPIPPVTLDMSKAQPLQAARQPAPVTLDMSKAKPISSTAPSTPPTLGDTTPMADPADGKPYEEPETKGPLHQVGGFLQGAGENVAGAVKGVHDLFQEPQNDDEKAVQQKLMIGTHGELGGRLALAGYRFLHGVNDTMTQMDKAGKVGAKEAKDSGSLKAGLLTDMENEPFIGNATKLSEQGEYGKALGDLLTSVGLMRAGEKGAAALPETGEAAEAAIPKPTVVAGTKLPETVGQSAARANPVGIGTDVKGMEDVARKIPGSEGLRNVSTQQQGAAREVLANKAAKATGAATATTPEAIEQNATNAAEAARTSGSAKYEEIGKTAAGADFTKPVEAAHSILTDDTLGKVLPKSAKDALGKVASSLSEREEVAHQIYGKAFGDIDTTQQAEVGKAMSSGPSASTPAFENILKARSEIADAANGMKDASDRFRMHQALDQYDQAIGDSLAAHDTANGTNLTGTLAEAKKLWSQKYAFEEFRDGLQDVMRDQPHTGNREINGAAFQKLVNDLDPRGAKGTTPLQRMFPGDVQSVKDIHDLADFMGRNQGGAGGMASGMAKLRLLGLKESALGLIANVVGFSWLLSKPNVARAMLTVLTAGKNVAKASAAIGLINNAASFRTDGEDQNAPASLASPSAAIPSKTQPSTDLGRSNRQPIDTSGHDATARNASTTNNATPAANVNPDSITASGQNPSTARVPEGRVPVTIPGTSQTYHFPSKDAADAFRQSAGIQ